MKHLTGISLVLAIVVAAVPAGSADTPKKKPDVSGVVKGGNQFALDLYAQLRDREGNQFFSPFSISTALAMTYAGARGQTAEEIAKTLHFADDQIKLHKAFGAVLRQTTGGQQSGFQLNFANALWGQKNYGFLPDFLTLTRTHYGAGLKEVDFATATEQARRTINAWVEQQTQDKIKEVLQPGVLTPKTRLVLTNAIYFKGDWKYTFAKASTTETPFHASAKTKVKVPMMQQTAEFKHLEDGDYQALELPYATGDLSMLILLPKAVDGLSTLEKKLSPAWLDKVRSRMQIQEVIVSLPKFKLTQSYALADILAGMGMPTAFEPGKADFSGMNGSTEKLFISAVIHKAFVDVNEKGTEAAATTAVVIDPQDAEIPRPMFRADHPFVFLIRDNRSGTILFLGRLVNPQG
jgi:serpin B